MKKQHSAVIKTKKYLHTDTDDNLVSLHDCYCNRIQCRGNIVSFYFNDGFWILPSHSENQAQNPLRTDSAQMNCTVLCDIDDITVYLFRKNIFGRIIRTEWSMDKFMQHLNRKKFCLEFLWQYKNNGERIYKCWLHFDKKPYTCECQLEIPVTGVEYQWNRLFYDRNW